MSLATGAIAMVVPITNFFAIHPEIEKLRTPGEGPGVRALYSHLPPKSAIVAENYWLARLINYMHYSGEVQPDPNPRVLDSDPVDVNQALADGLQVYAFEGATHWLDSQGYVFEHTNIALEPFQAWIRQQPNGTMIAVAAAGRPLPFEWLPAASRPQGGRPANFGVVAWTLGDGSASVEQNDAGATAQQSVGSDHRVLTITANEDGPQMLLGDDVIASIDRGLAVVAFSPAGDLIGQWSFSLDDTPGVQLPPTPYVLHGQSACEVLRPGQATDIAELLVDGSVLATVEGANKAAVTLDTDAAPATWRLRFSNGRGNASIEGAQLMLEPFAGTRAVFRLSVPPAPARAIATLAPGPSAVRLCAAEAASLPANGSLEVGADHDQWFGTGWHLGERGGTQRFRWSSRSSSLTWKMAKPARIRMLLRLRPANANGATLQASIGGSEVSSCKLPGGAWTECSVVIPESSTHAGINQLTLKADTISPSADRPGDARELSFVMQASRVRVGQ